MLSICQIMLPVERRQGMSRNQGPRVSLLSTFRSLDSPSAPSPDRFGDPPERKKMKDEPAIDAPPMATDDEIETSEDELNKPDLPMGSRIQPVIFGTLSSRKGPEQSGKTSPKSVALRGTKSGSATISAGSKRPAEDTGNGRANPHLDDISFTTTTSNKTAGHRSLGTKKTKNTYGATKKTQIRAPRSKPKPRDRSVSSSSERAKFNPHTKFGALDLEVPDTSTTKFNAPDPFSPSPERKRRSKTFGLPGSDFTEDSEPHGSLGLQKRKADRSRIKSKNKLQLSPKQEAPKAKFAMPGGLDPADLENLDNAGQDEMSPAVSDAESEKTDGDELSSIKLEGDFWDTKEAKCPMCEESVDPWLLKKNLVNGRMNVRKQMAFCKLHKQKKAASAGVEKGYPKIDWDGLNARLAQHMPRLQEILEGTQSSQYAAALRDKVDSGKDRTLLKTHDTLTPGYYGPRGLRAMTEYILQSLSAIVRKRAVEDRLIAARGYTGYVQAVLVPELAIRLIMEDMVISEAEAKRVLKDSVEVGDLLHEDSGDVIADMSDDEI